MGESIFYFLVHHKSRTSYEGWMKPQLSSGRSEQEWHCLMMCAQYSYNIPMHVLGHYGGRELEDGKWVGKCTKIPVVATVSWHGMDFSRESLRVFQCF